jgi:endonuclease I
MTRLIPILLMLACGDKNNDTGKGTDTPPDTDTDTDTMTDADSDGHGEEVDCDDGDASVYPGATERCNGEDDDCDGQVHVTEQDSDGDGALDCASCAAAGFWPGVLEVTDTQSVESAFSAWFPGRACTDYQDERAYLFTELSMEEGQVEGIYTGVLFSFDPKNPDWKTVNTEHVWPRSDGAGQEPVECDLHHLFPADSYVNGLRGALAFGVVEDADWQSNGSAKGADANGEDVFEPRDARKGDIARAILYIAARYPSQTDRKAQRGPAELALFQAWSASDPPDAAEVARGEGIAARQGGQNPFIACPDLANRIQE